MRTTSPEELRTLLVERIARTVPLPDGADRSELARRVAAVLDQPTLTAEEETLVLAGPGDDGNVVNDVLSHRIERAWHAGADAAATLARTAPAGGAPTIVALRDDAIADAASFADTLTRGVSMTLAREPAGADRPTLVLAQSRAFETLRESADSLRTLDPSLAFAGETARDDDAATEVLCVAELLDPVAEQARGLAAWNGIPLEPIDPMLGQVFANKYEIEKCVGRGGFGSVYLATDNLLHNRVAIKVLTPRTAVTARQKQAFREQLEEFKEEARRLVRLEHECIVNWKVFDETEGGTYYFVMELLQGEELHDLLEREGRLAPDRVANILLQVLGALRAAHHLSEHESILHLDLKPKNVFHLAKASEDEPDRVKVIDFGIGQFIGAEPSRSSRGGDAAGAGGAKGETLIESGEADTRAPRAAGGFEPSLGTIRSVVHRSTACTPEYASPEQCTHMLSEEELAEYGVKLTALDGRSDLYSLGVMGFQLLTGQLPFERPQDRREFLRLHLTKPPRRVGSTGVKVPRKLAAFIDRCLVKDRDARWTDTREAYDALERVVHPPIARRVALVGAPLLAAAVGVTYALVGGGGPKPFSTPAALADGVYLGVERPELALDVDLPDELRGRPASLVGSSNRPDATRLDWTLAWRDGRLLFRPPPDVGDFDATAQLEIVAPNGVPHYSNAQERFRVRYLPEDAVAATSISVPDLGTKRLDPIGQRLGIEVAGAEADIGSVTVAGPWEAPRRSVLDRGASDGTRTRYTLELGGADLPPGPVELTARVVDRAGRATERALPLDVVPDRLAFTGGTPRLEGVSPIGTGYLVTPAAEPRLAIELNGVADVRWSVHRSDRSTLRSDGDSGVAGGTFELDLSADESYEGYVEIQANDDPYVLRADSDRAATAAVRIPFEYDLKAPHLVVELVRPGRATLRLETDEPHYLNLEGDPPSLRITRVHGEMPVVAELDLGAPDSARASPPMLDSLAAAFEPVLELPSEGEHRVVVRGFRCDSSTGERQGDPVAHGPFTFVVDRSPPRLRVEPATADALLTDEAWTPPAATLHVDDEALPETAVRTPVRVRWSVRRGDETVTEDEVPEPVVPPGGLELALGDLRERAGRLGGTIDGVYRVRVTGIDLAGNTAAEASWGWTLATEGPTIQRPRKPQADLEWEKVGTPAGPRWEIELGVADPNGVERVLCEIRDEAGELEPIAVELAENPSVPDIWGGSLLFPVEWSKRAVRLRVEAVDAFERRSERVSDPLTVGEVKKLYPPRVRVARAGVATSTTPMRLVPGNDGAPYSFHGRGRSDDELLNRLYPRSVHLGSEDKGRDHWTLDYPKGAIESFYLDEDEVTVGQFEAFLAAPGGYRAPESWTGDPPPGEGRLAELEERLRGLPDDVPVTNVTWSEADAYARWAGKRLPSYPEWEWAVRGPEYRPFPSHAGELEAPDRGAVNYDNTGASPLWPVTRGSDVTPDTRIRNLGSNVAEWTRTPADYAGDDAPSRDVSDKDVAAGDPGRFLDPRPDDVRCARYWAAGTSYRTTRFDFLYAERVRRRSSLPFLGFRCALPADLVHDAARAGGAGGIRAEPLDP